ncbi:hypothetical protein AWM75_07125 [Aerococcus urinaehominis]|uniref:Uncharacterized protein n=1 Tax=Aerococcus urinaehominis TaxID=128944 RepID=A0A0X8FM36_9LACT|nr:helix-turn-helix domain-containing protein [Aerococcus urinaehominis]AMB99747.1 hypothetical protein AWM75_07125 [Aerococcus urinaehominis]SDM10459.1 Mga helix-turn-helix domain-containing protein [Aerococcus urinaehominis]
MHELLKLQDQRHLSLITLFYYNQQPLDLSYLAQEMNLSERTVSELITETNNRYTYLTIQARPDQSLELLFQEGINIDSFFHDLYAQSTAYQLIEYIFFNEACSINDLEKQMTISRSSIQRTLSQIRSVLQANFSITISRSPYRLEGREADIRYFYTHYFMEKYEGSNWPFTFNLQDFDDLIQDVALEINYNDYFIDYRHLRFYIAVNFFRYQAGHLTEDFTDKAEQVIEQLSPQVLDRLQQFFGQAMTPALAKQIFGRHVARDFYYTIAEMHEKLPQNNYYSQLNAMFVQQMDLVCQEFNMTLANRDLVILEMHNSYFLNTNPGNRKYILHNHSAIIISDLRQHYPKVIDLLITSYQNVPASKRNLFRIDRALHQIIVSSAATVWEDFFYQIQAQLPKVKIAIINIARLAHIHIIKENLNYWFGQAIEFVTPNQLHYGQDQMVTIDADIIISASSVQVADHVHYISIRETITYNEINQIMAAILAVRNQAKLK